MLMVLRMPFDSYVAEERNISILKTIRRDTLDASCELTQRDDPYETHQGSPASQD